HFEIAKWVDIEPLELRATWKNKKGRMDGVTRCLDIFLVHQALLDKLINFRSWVNTLRCLDHFSICVEIVMEYEKLKEPFKYNPYWLTKDEFQEVVKSSWKPIDVHCEDSTRIQLTRSLRLVKENRFLG